MVPYPDKLTALFAKQIDCSGDPFNVTRPGQELADFVAQQAMARPNPNYPHIVNFGEIHTSVSNILLQQTFLESMRARHPYLKLAVGLEFAENLPLLVIQNMRKMPEEFNSFFFYASPLPYLTLVNMWARNSHLGVASYLEENQIPSTLTDAPRHSIYGDIIVQDGERTTGLGAHHPDATIIRNNSMHGNLLRLATDQKADVAIQFTGSAHLFGEEGCGQGFTGSLVDLAESRQQPHTVIMPNPEFHDCCFTIPDQALRCQFMSAVYLTKLDLMDYIMFGLREDAAIRSTAKHSGFTPPDVEAWKVKAQASIHKDLQETSARMGKAIDQLTPRVS